MKIDRWYVKIEVMCEHSLHCKFKIAQGKILLKYCGVCSGILIMLALPLKTLSSKQISRFTTFLFKRSMTQINNSPSCFSFKKRKKKNTFILIFDQVNNGNKTFSTSSDGSLTVSIIQSFRQISKHEQEKSSFFQSYLINYILGYSNLKR